MAATRAPKGLKEWLAFANKPGRAASNYRLFFGGLFALGCGLFLTVEIVFFGLVATSGPSWGFPFVAGGFLFIGAICSLGGLSGIREYARGK